MGAWSFLDLPRGESCHLYHDCVPGVLVCLTHAALVTVAFQRLLAPNCLSSSFPQEDPDAVPPDASETSMTTTSAISIHEYFAQRMAERKDKALRRGAGPESPDTPMAGKVAKKRKKAARDRSVDAPAQDGPEKQKDNDQEARDGDTYSPMWPSEKPGKKKRLRQVEDGLASDGDLVKKKKKKKKCSE